MKKMCANCKSGKAVDKSTVDRSVELQAAVEKTGEEFAGMPERKEKIAAVKASAEYADLAEITGLDSLSKKDTDPEEGSLFVVCSNPQHLADERAEKGIVHKYYFECPHFVANE